MDIGALEPGAGRARTVRLDRVRVLGEAGVAHVQRAVSGEGLAGASRAGRKHAIEHVDPAHHGLDDVVRLADAHQIARLFNGQHAGREIEAAEHRFLPFADSQPTDRIAIEADLDQRLGRGFAHALVERALLDAEQRSASCMVFAAIELVARSPGPAHRARHRFALRLVARGCRDELVERHRNIRPEQALDFDRPFGREHVRRAVEVTFEANAFLAGRGERGKAHHLIAAAVRQDRPVPAHESMQPAKLRDALGAGPKHQMIGVAKEDVGARLVHLLGTHGLDRRRGPDRHECRAPHFTALHGDRSRARGAVGGVDREAEAGHWLDGLAPQACLATPGERLNLYAQFLGNRLSQDDPHSNSGRKVRIG